MEKAMEYVDSKLKYYIGLRDYIDENKYNIKDESKYIACLEIINVLETIKTFMKGD